MFPTLPHYRISCKPGVGEGMGDASGEGRIEGFMDGEGRMGVAVGRGVGEGRVGVEVGLDSGVVSKISLTVVPEVSVACMSAAVSEIKPAAAWSSSSAFSSDSVS